MTNPYKIHLDKFFETITDFKHTSKRLNKVLMKDAEIYTSEGATFYSGTALIIGDWTGPTDNGWKINFHTGSSKETLKGNYSREINKILSREFGFALAQCYESLETLMKDLIDVKLNTDSQFREGFPNNENLSRESLKGGEDIFKMIKKAGGKKFKQYSKENNNFKFSEFFKLLSEIRHAITHSQGILKTKRIPKTNYYNRLFEHFLPMNKLGGDSIRLYFEYKDLDRLLTYISEFGYQLFKIQSELDNYNWKI